MVTAEVALAFRRAARAKPGPELVSWESDWDLAAAIPGSPVVPDAHVVLATERMTLDVFLEVDRATERPAAFARKIRAYLDWHWSGTWRQHLKVWPLVLVVTPTALRGLSLRRTTETVLAGFGGEGTEFRFAQLEEVLDAGPFAAIWQVAGHPGVAPLLLSPAAATQVPA